MRDWNLSGIVTLQSSRHISIRRHWHPLARHPPRPRKPDQGPGQPILELLTRTSEDSTGIDGAPDAKREPGIHSGLKEWGRNDEYWRLSRRERTCGHCRILKVVSQ